jgi:hypothetical protein
VPRPPAARARGIIAALLVVVGFVLTPLGVIGFWSHQTLTDTQRYLDTVGPIGDDAATKAAIAEFITDKIEAKVDPDELVREIFGDLIERYPRLELMVPIVAGAVDSVSPTPSTDSSTPRSSTRSGADSTSQRRSPSSSSSRASPPDR